MPTRSDFSGAVLAVVATAALLLAAVPTMALPPLAFDVADRNHDGRVTLSEFETWATERLLAGNSIRARRFRAMSPALRDARLRYRFDAMDVGHKGTLDRADWTGA